MRILEELKYDGQGLIPVVVQETGTGRVLMLAWMNRESLAKTLQLGQMVYWSRSRKQLWHKGATSGHTQKLIRLAVDCDKDCLLAEVEQLGAACHDGYKSCFYRTIEGETLRISEPRMVDPEKVYGSKGSRSAEK